MRVTLLTPAEIATSLARRLRARRLDRGWSQTELAARSNVAPDTLKRFERTGEVSLTRLIRLSLALGLASELEGLFAQTVPESLEVLERPKRQRGRSMGARRATP